MLKLYGIPNCNTVRKAKNWLKDNDIEFEFHNYKKKSIDKNIVQQWVAQVGLEILVNKKGTTWKELDISLQGSITNEASAIDLMVNKNSVIKRPIIETNDVIVIIGYDTKKYKDIFF